MAEDPIAEIKNKIGIVDLVQSYLPLTKSGKNYKALCPFHNEKTPSFMVSPELGIFKCFGCGKGGDIFAFLQEMEGVGFGEALQTLAQRSGVKLHRSTYQSSPDEARRERLLEVNHLAGEYFHFLLTSHPVGKKALAYLTQKRGLSLETIKTFNLGYAPESWDSLGKFLIQKGYGVEEAAGAGLVLAKEKGRGFYDRFRGRVMFPLYSPSGRLTAFSGRILTEAKDQPKYLNSPESPVFSKSRFLYGLHLAKTEIKKSGYALLVEGQLDLITPFQAGLKNVVATGGTALTMEQLRLLKRYTENLHLGFDADLAGNAALQRGITLAERLGLNLKVVLLPAGAKDPDDAVRQNQDLFLRVVEEAVSIYDYYFRYAKERYPGESGLDKKHRAQLIIPVVAQISNEVQKAYYVGRLAGELGVEESVVWKELKKSSSLPAKHEGSEVTSSPVTPRRPLVEEYLLCLLLKSSLALAQPILYKLGQKDFPDPLLNEIFVALKDYLLGRKRSFDMRVFLKKLTDEARARVEELYLFDLGDLDPESPLWEQEVGQAFAKVKEGSVRRELREITRKIRQAEQLGREEETSRWQAEFAQLSQKLVEKT